ncbi:MAG: RHS repeat-associated core domain-containing protein [Pseudomonas putida]
MRYGENDDPGHLLPGTQPQRVLPRVTTHEVKPRADQPPLKTTYTYTHFDEENNNEVAHSFVGSNSNVSWRDDGEDNLYRAQSSYRYRYDGHNDLIGVRHEQAAEVSRRYQGYRLSSTRDADLLTEYLYAGDRPLGLQRPGQTADNRLYATDAANSVVGECSSDELHDNVYTAYGDSPDNDQLVGLLGFNGEARERALGWSLLGRGYRAYNPGLMRFHSPDTAAPEDAGINPYVYCGGNPVNWRDPSGHYGMRHSMEAPYVPPKPKPKADWRSWLGLAVQRRQRKTRGVRGYGAPYPRHHTPRSACPVLSDRSNGDARRG